TRVMRLASLPRAVCRTISSMLSASAISCMTDLDRARDARVERLHRESCSLPEHRGVVRDQPPEAAHECSFRMEIPLGRRDDLIMRDTALREPHAMQKQPAR